MRLIALTLLIISLPLQAAELRDARPAAQGMSADRLERIDALAQRHLSAGHFPNMHVMVNRGGRIVHETRTGTMGIDDARPLPEDAIWRIYSMTKPITAVAALMLYEEGAFQLTDPITRLLPEMAELQVHTDQGLVPVAKAPTIQQLMTHTAGFGYIFTPHPSDEAIRQADVFASKDLDTFVRAIAAIPLIDQPGERWSYSVASSLLGALVERAAGVPFDTFLRTRLFEPLDMRDTAFKLAASKRDRLVTSQTQDPKTGKPVVVEPGSSALALGPEGASFPAGGVGLFSTTRDYMRFAEMLRAGGTLDGARILSPKTIEYMASNHLVVPAAGTGEAPQLRLGNLYPEGFGFGLGVSVLESPQAIGTLASAGEFGWGGAAGTVFWVDPAEDIVVVGMIQLLSSPWPLRDELRVLTNGAITRTAQ
jgi:CubicO group peptidase (beta-lactamase class C family)